MLRTAFIAIALVLSSCATMQKHETGFLDRSVTLHGTEYPYTVYVPRDFDRAKKLPVILFLHGSGERGNDGLRPSQVGLGTSIRFEPSRVPAIVVFPQAPSDTRWIGEPADAAMLALDRTIDEFSADRARQYLTGLSMGGYGTIHLALANPNRFSALVIVCGGLLPHPSTTAVRRSPLIPENADPYTFVGESLHKIPIWLFHGADDTVIPADESHQILAALKKAGAADVHFTEYPGVGHNAWDKAYATDEMFTWLFSKKRVAGLEVQ